MDSTSGCVGGSHDDAGLGGGDSALAAELADRVVEVSGVSAGELDDEVEAAGDEDDSLRCDKGEGEALERRGVGRREQAHIDVGDEAAAKLLGIDLRGVPADDAAAFQSPDALRDGMSAEADFVGDLGVGRATVSDEDIEDSVVNRVRHGRYHSRSAVPLACRLSG